MDNEKTIENEIREYRAQFEKSMASIGAYQEKAQVEIAEIRALSQEDRESLKEIRELQKQTDEGLRELKERQKQTDEQMRKTDEQIRKTDEQIRKTDEQIRKTGDQIRKTGKQLSELNSNWGRFVESLVEGSLVELLSERGIDITGTLPNVKTHYDDDDGRRHNREFDIIVRNGEDVVVVEVKTSLRPDDVTRFIESMKMFTRFLPEYRTKRVYGAVAYIRSLSHAELYAEKQRLFVIRATGDSASIVNDEGFEPVSFTQVSPGPTRGHLRAVPAG